MKKLKSIVIWAMLSIMLQCVVLLYFDKVVFKETKASDIKISSVESKKQEGKINYSIPEGIDEFKISDDGKYLAYIQDEKFMVVDLDSLKTENSKESIDPETATREIITGDEANYGAEIMYYKWIQDEDFLIIVEKVYKNSYSSVLKLLTYNVRNDEIHEMSELCTYKEGMVVDNIVCSLGSGTNYVGISRDGYNSNIYRVDINEDMSKITYNLPALGNFSAVEDYDILVFEDSLNKAFYYYTNGSTKSIPVENSNNLTLIGVDNEKNVYLGEMSGEKINKIIYGQYDSDSSTWNSIELEKEKDISDIILNSDGEILINDNLTGVIKNINSDKELTYDGKLISITNEYVCTEDKGKLVLKSLEELND